MRSANVSEMSERSVPPRDPATRAVHPPRPPVRQEPLVAPLYGTSVFTFPGLEEMDDAFRQPDSFVYSRMENPNSHALGQQIAALEGAEAGVAVSSGQAATFLAVEAAAQEAGTLHYAHHLYGGTLDLIVHEIGRRRRIEPFDAWGGPPPELARGDAVLVESLSNPSCRPSPLGGLARACREAGATLVVDNTFATPVSCRPLLRGAELVVHSLTKAISGHAHVILGAVAGRADLVREAARLKARLGMVADPRAAWLALEGAKTLFVRQERSVANATWLAGHLARHPAVAQVSHPSLLEDLSWRQDLILPGSLLAFDVGTMARASQFTRALRLIALAPSLGDVATTISHPGLSSHRGLDGQGQAAIGVTPGLIRLSVGIEQVEDLWADLSQALEQLP